MKNFFSRSFNQRVVCAGRVFERYVYEKPVIKGLERKRAGRSASFQTSEEVKAENRNKTANRAKNTIKRYANANPQLTKFLTLTFAQNIIDLDYARYEFDKFIKRLKTRYAKFSFQYIVVVEFQKRGAIHFHLLCNLPYVQANTLAEIWSHGFINIQRLDNIDNVGSYITKYMTKDNFDERLCGRKCYSMSKNLNKPKCYTKDSDIEEIMQNLDSVQNVFTAEYDSEYFGKVYYCQIICKNVIPPPRKQHKLSRLIDSLSLLPDDTPCPFPI